MVAKGIDIEGLSLIAGLLFFVGLALFFSNWGQGVVSSAWSSFWWVAKAVGCLIVGWVLYVFSTEE